MVKYTNITHIALALGLAIAGVTQAQAISILAGSDYLRATNGELDFGPMDIPGFGVVDLDPLNVLGGLPFGSGALGNADTVIQRLEDATVSDNPMDFDFDIVPAKLSAMSLQSAGLINIGGQDFEVRLTFTPPPQQNGALRIQHEFGPPGASPGSPGFFAGGTVTSPTPLPANLKVSFTPTTGGASVAVLEQVDLKFGSSNFWDTRPDAGTVFVTGAPGDLNANRHVPLDGSFDFFPDTELFTWRLNVFVEDIQIGFVDLRSASAVPEGGPGLMGALILVGACIGRQLIGAWLAKLCFPANTRLPNLLHTRPAQLFED